MDRYEPGHILKTVSDLAVFVGGMPAKAVPVNSTGASALLMSGPCLFVGAWMVNNSTTAGRVSVFDGVDGSGDEVSRFTISASSLSTPSVPSRGILLEIGCFMSVTAGTVSGAVYLVPLWRYRFTPPGE